MAITLLPPAPSRASGSATFSDDADAFVAALPLFAIEANALASDTNAASALAIAAANTASNAPGTQAGSSTSLTIGATPKSLAIETGKALRASMWLLLVDNGNANNWMIGPITSYNSGTGALVVGVQYTSGSGTSASWTVVHIPPIRFQEATKEQIWAGTSAQVAFSPASWRAALATVPIAYAASLTLDGATFIRGSTTVTGNIVFPNPVNLVPGYVYSVRLLIGGAGNWTLGFGAAWEFIGDQIPTLSPTAGLTDILRFEAIDGGKVAATLEKARTL